LDLADNIYGIHHITTASGKVYELTIRDFQDRNGYCTCPDFRTNKLGTCKHLLFAQREIIRTLPVERLTTLQPFPFVEIFCDPHQDYRISYFYHGKLTLEVASLLEKYFKGHTHLRESQYPEFVFFLKETEGHQKILVRPEVREVLDRHFDDQLMAHLAETVEPDFTRLKLPLEDYQKEGVRFSLFKRGTIIADDMGLGKARQAVAVATLKEQLYGFRRTLIVCPAARKRRWAREIQRMCDLDWKMVEGGPAQREAIYRDSDAFFLIANYESVVHDEAILKRFTPDMIILDEAQRIKNYLTRTSFAVKAVPKKHSLVLTGTPISRRPGDLYSIMNFIDPRILAPLWEFSMQHCTFSRRNPDRIAGYFNLDSLAERIAPWVVRREKQDVGGAASAGEIIDLPVQLHPRQLKQYSGLARTVSALLQKPHMTVYDLQRLLQLLDQLRMVCSSTFLLDRQSNISPKLDELEEVLLEKLDLPHSPRKVVIFSEWKALLKLVGNLLNGHGISHALLSGDLSGNEGKALLERFATREDCQVLLTTDCQFRIEGAETVIFMEPTLESGGCRGRLDRLVVREKAAYPTVLRLVSQNCIDQHISEGVTLETAFLHRAISNGALGEEAHLEESGKGFLKRISRLIAVGEEQLSEEQIESLQSGEQPAAGKQLHLFEENALYLPRRRRLRSRVEESKPNPLPLSPPRIETSPSPPQKKSVADYTADKEPSQDPKLEKALEQGMQFLNSLVELSTGKKLDSKDQAISIDPETGEVILRFRIGDKT
ncbi:MAG: DEAD/DEAH box helicase, partial [Calditrichaeota bacterium]|nr:DEAD/DEAH box helicase [Calditrichota bacterium]